MDIFSNQKSRLLTLCALAVALIVSCIWLYLSSHKPMTGSSPWYATSANSSAASVENDTKGTVPGNPANGERALSNLYKLYSVYKGKHGNLPPNVAVLMDDFVKNPSDYGMKSSDIKNLIGNPDNKYSDIAFQRSMPSTPSFWSDAHRPDGSAIFGPRRSGTRDVLAVSETYFHENVKYFGSQQSSSNPVGFYQVLWDDGTVSRVAYDKVLYVVTQQGNKNYTFTKAFPGQAGTPDNALSYDQYYTKIAGWKEAPHGKAGGPGLTYNSKSRP